MVQNQCEPVVNKARDQGPPWLMVRKDGNIVSSPRPTCGWRRQSPSRRGAWRLLKKYRRSRRKHMKREEYRRLRSMVPAIATKPGVSKVQVIEETIKYIDELHSALIARFKSVGVPSRLQGFPIDVAHIEPAQIKELVRKVLPAPPSMLSHRERAKRLPSFLEKAARWRSRRLE